MDTGVTKWVVITELNYDRRVTVRDIAGMFSFSVSTKHQIIAKHFDFQKVCARWVLLSANEKLRQVSAPTKILQR